MILNCIERYDFGFHWNMRFWISLKDIILNVIEKFMVLNCIERKDFEFHWKIWFCILFKDMIFNFVERYNFECDWKIYFWILRILTSIESFDKRSLTISISLLITAVYKAVL